MNFIILIYLIAIGPKLFFDRILRGKRHPSFLQRMGWRLPQASKPVIWIHAISVGEVKGVQTLFRELKKREPGAFFLVTTTTATGQAEAKRSLPEADAFAYLPLDFSWVVRRWVKKLNPKLFVLMESDFWFNLLAALKENGTKTVLVNGKMSEKSARRFQKFSFFSKKLFSHFDHLCVQNVDYLQKFLPFVRDAKRLHVTGNLKFDIEPQPVDILYWQKKLNIQQPILTISCTHAPEEVLLIEALKGSGWFIILAPRHPERFSHVAEELTKRNVSFFRWSHLEGRRGGESVLLIDAMGELPICYSLSRLALVAGSYVDHIGGHNVLEPCLYGVPVLFGPYTYAQKELAAEVIAAGAGALVPITELRFFINTFASKEKSMKAAALKLFKSCQGAAIRTLAVF